MKWEQPCALAAPVDSEGVAGQRSRRGLPDSVQPHAPDSNAHLPFGLLHLPEVMTRYFVVQAQLASAVDPAADVLLVGHWVHALLPGAP